MTIVAIHQPNLFPWLGYFDKMVRADRFVFLDGVQMPLTGSSYVNRVNILAEGKARAIQIPTVRGSEARRLIATTPMADQPKWREKLFRTIQQAYARAPFAPEILTTLEPLVIDAANHLGPYNENAIRALGAKIGIPEQKFARSTQLNVAGSSNNLLIDIVKACGGDAYLAGGGAGGYQDDTAFAAAGLKVVYQSFSHPTYPQLGKQDFVPGLSIIDSLMNLGFQGTSNLLDAASR
ncbi:MAG TPA: WbqC family protein [Chthoniobacterales bacterium]